MESDISRRAASSQPQASFICFAVISLFLRFAAAAGGLKIDCSNENIITKAAPKSLKKPRPYMSRPIDVNVVRPLANMVNMSINLRVLSRDRPILRQNEASPG